MARPSLRARPSTRHPAVPTSVNEATAAAAWGQGTLLQGNIVCTAHGGRADNIEQGRCAVLADSELLKRVRRPAMNARGAGYGLRDCAMGVSALGLGPIHHRACVVGARAANSMAADVHVPDHRTMRPPEPPPTSHRPMATDSASPLGWAKFTKKKSSSRKLASSPAKGHSVCLVIRARLPCLECAWRLIRGDTARPPPCAVAPSRAQSPSPA